MNIEVLKFRGWTLTLDKSEVIADDPGAGTPAMVESPNGVTGSYFCAIGTGELGCGDEQIPSAVLAWLNKQGGHIDDFLFGDPQ